MHMNKLLLSTLLAVSSLSSLWAQEIRVTVTPESEQRSCPRKAVSTACPLLEEDFSGFSDPLPTEYKLNNMLSSYENPEIDPALTHGNQWRGWKVWQSEGSAALVTFDPMAQAYLETPQMDYSGHITVTFRAKFIKAEWLDEASGKKLHWTGGSILAALMNEGGEDFITQGAQNNQDPTQVQLADVRLYENMGWTEIKIEFDNYSAYNDAYLVFYTGSSVLIDDIRVTSSNDAFIAAPIVRDVTDVTEDSFTINFEPVRYSYNYYVYLYTLKGYDESTGEPIYEMATPKWLLEELESMGCTLDEYLEMLEMSYEEFMASFGLDDISNPYTNYDTVESAPWSYTFTDLDPNTDYYYAVRSHHVKQFSAFDTKDIRKMQKIAAPATQLAENVTANGFTAMWSPIAKADSYEVHLYGAEIAKEDTEDFIIFEENFDKVSDFTDATSIYDPEYLDYDSDLTINDLTTSAGWTLPISKAILIQGHLGVQPYYVISSPNIWVDGAEEVNFSLSLKSSYDDGDVRFVFGGTMYQIPLESGVFEGEFSLPTNGMKECPIQIAGNECDVFIDYIIAKQNLKAGAETYTYMGTYATEEKATTSMDFKDLDTNLFPCYAYSVQAVRGEGQDAIRSLANQRVIVDLAQGNSQLLVDNLTDDNLRTVECIYDINGNIVKSLQKGFNIIKYNDGSLVKMIIRK